MYIHIYVCTYHTWATPPTPPIWGGISRLAKRSRGWGPKAKCVKIEKNREKVKEKSRKMRKNCKKATKKQEFQEISR